MRPHLIPAFGGSVNSWIIPRVSQQLYYPPMCRLIGDRQRGLDLLVAAGLPLERRATGSLILRCVGEASSDATHDAMRCPRD